MMTSYILSSDQYCLGKKETLSKTHDLPVTDSGPQRRPLVGRVRPADEVDGQHEIRQGQTIVGARFADEEGTHAERDERLCETT